MSHLLLPSTPIQGHVGPILTIGRHLVARGHRVTVLTGGKYRPAVEAAGLTFLGLPAEVDYDDADLGPWLPRRDRYQGIAAGRYDIIGMFIRPLVGQHRAFTEALATGAYDGVVSEAAFLGVLPTLLTVAATDRVPVVGVSATPLSLRSVDCAPFGSGLAPGDSSFSRLRNRQIDFLLRHGPLRPIQRALDAALAELGAPPGLNYFDHAAEFDQTFHLAVAGFEYPRRELPESVRFVGPLAGPGGGRAQAPGWLSELDGSRPVVHVTQGTMANTDLGQLLAPAVRGLADSDALVVVSTGGRPVQALLDELGGRQPGNVRVAEFLPYDQLLPRTDVMVTNGGFGGVQCALAYGLPLVVAGTSEDKPEVAARIAWSGTGINLRTDRPSPARIRRAVGAALHQRRYGLAARRLQAEIAAQPDPATTIAQAVEALVRAAQSRGSTGSDSSAKMANTHSCTRHSGSPAAARSSASSPSAYSRDAMDRLCPSPRDRSRARLGGSV